MSPNPIQLDAGDLAWLAFRYVADEMAGDELVSFEQLLLNDQRAREEVAKAVELTQAIATVPAEVSLPARSPSWSYRLSWMAVGTAACLAVVAALEFLKQSEAPLASKPAEDTQNLAAAWVGSQHAFADESASDSTGEHSSEFVGTELAEHEVATDEDMSVPGWVLAAVGGTPRSDAAEQRPNVSLEN